MGGQSCQSHISRSRESIMAGPDRPAHLSQSLQSQNTLGGMIAPTTAPAQCTPRLLINPASLHTATQIQVTPGPNATLQPTLLKHTHSEVH